MTDTIEVPRELLYRISNVYAAGLTMDEEIAELRVLLAQPASVPDEVRKDAERYRWLVASGVNVASVGGEPVRLTEEMVDAAMVTRADQEQP